MSYTTVKGILMNDINMAFEVQRDARLHYLPKEKFTLNSLLL